MIIAIAIALERHIILNLHLHLPLLTAFLDFFGCIIDLDFIELCQDLDLDLYVYGPTRCASLGHDQD